MWQAAGKILASLPWKDIVKGIRKRWKIALIVALGCLVLMRGCTIDRLEESARGYNEAIEKLNRALLQNGEALALCRKTNELNAAMAARQRRAALMALARVEALENEAEHEIENIDITASEIREQVDGECPALSDPDFLDWVYDRP